jgi:HAD superfamily hydrolase (TIGR01549 family)
LYDQARMRRTMAGELMKLPLRQPASAVRVWRVLSAYRRAQEVLRHQVTTDLSSTTQYERAASASGLPVAVVQRIVDEWMFQRPLRHMMHCRATALEGLLAFLRDREVRLGVLSDYPAAEKLRALGVADYFSLVLCATDPEVLAFKPRPNGFLEAARRWGLPPSEVLMIGDRADSDGAGARAADMPCVIVGEDHSESASFFSVSSLERLRDVLDDNGR